MQTHFCFQQEFLKLVKPIGEKHCQRAFLISVAETKHILNAEKNSQPTGQAEDIIRCDFSRLHTYRLLVA